MLDKIFELRNEIKELSIALESIEIKKKTNVYFMYQAYARIQKAEELIDAFIKENTEVKEE